MISDYDVSAVVPADIISLASGQPKPSRQRHTDYPTFMVATAGGTASLFVTWIPGPLDSVSKVPPTDGMTDAVVALGEPYLESAVPACEC